MATLPRVSGLKLKISNYKSLGPDGIYLGQFKNSNIVIGRNNTGKSAIIDIIELLCRDGVPQRRNYHAGTPTRLDFWRLLPKDILIRAFPENMSSHDMGGYHWHAVGQFLVEGEMQYRTNDFQSFEFVGLDKERARFMDVPAAVAKLADVANQMANPLKNAPFARVLADRDVRPEPMGNDVIQGDGRGLTAAVAYILNMADQPSELIEIEVLSALNEIMSPDAQFSSIIVQQTSNANWEIYLIDHGGRRVALSDSGSGLKTVFLVLGVIIVNPYLQKKPIIEYVLAFEELENNLHPALQRRLFRYISDVTNRNDLLTFYTTHSSAVIDLFTGDSSAQIIHVAHDGRAARGDIVQTYFGNAEILTDLDVRASDMLQANGVIWVEGPSDRLYVNRWIELWTDGRLREGAHYQCLFYGGRLLAHLTAVDPTLDDADLVKVLMTNRNAIVLIDSDKKTKSSPIGSTKKRIRTEMDVAGSLAWVTQGREVENYIPQDVLSNLVNADAPPAGMYEDVEEYVGRLGLKEPKAAFGKSKVLFANLVLPMLTREGLARTLDLSDRLTEVVGRVDRWNGLV